MGEKKNRPDWIPDNAGEEFTTSIVKGIDGGHDGFRGSEQPKARRPGRNADD
ncbi:MAG: hypothetical protein HC808_19530 [Candidatus Competibacteraceae bacterium]|nr:hypothetical protein [Candidatus Competibacteraceae bacterium]